MALMVNAALPVFVTVTDFGVFTRWAEVVGEEVAAHATPVSLASGTLVVSVDHPTWATELRYLQSLVLGRLDEAVGAGVVRSLEVRVRPR